MPDQQERRTIGRALSIRQPWADLILAGVKDVENRTWAIPSTVELPLRIGVHASQNYDNHSDPQAWHALGAAWSRGPTGVRHRIASEGRTGALLGYVNVIGCHRHGSCDLYAVTPIERSTCSRWAEPGDVWHWTLTDPEPLPEPIPLNGSLGLWKMPTSAIEQPLDPSEA